MRPLLENVFLVAVNIAVIFSLFLFGLGFFPHKAFIPGKADWLDGEITSPVKAPFTKVIFMVVDALRSDFVYSKDSHFTFVQGQGSAIPFTGHASSPTVTMPRVKALTTGSVPTFLDLLLNFAESDTSSTLATQDSWLLQMKDRLNGSLVMYGDDTWLKLFPDFFQDADGTSSFFVSDFTEVDNNVTRHLPQELARDDWSAMILHYLGLDHIGHKTGPYGPLMGPKQKEMDDIVRNIYEAMESKPHLHDCLLILCGDHGMNEAGNHGGSSPGETSTALTFIAPKFQRHFRGVPSPTEPSKNYDYYDVFQQSDIVPTLAGLLGFPVPLNNLGVFLLGFLNMFPDDPARVELLRRNVGQILEIARGTFSSSIPRDLPATFEDCKGSAEEIILCEGVFFSKQFAFNPWMEFRKEKLYRIKWLWDAQKLLSRTASNYGVGKMYAGIIMTSVAVAIAFAMTWPQLASVSLPSISFLAMLGAYGGMHFASSYVEEEQQFWYWALSGWMCYLFIQERRKDSAPSFMSGSFAVACISFLFRVSRRWNQTGQKFAGAPDIAQFLTKHNILLWFLVIATYAVPSRQLCRMAAKWHPSIDLSLLPVPFTMAAVLFKLSFTDADAPELLEGLDFLDPLLDALEQISLVFQARVVFFGLFILLLSSVLLDPTHKHPKSTHDRFQTLHSLLTLFLLTQTSTLSIPLFLFNALTLTLLLHLLAPSSNSPQSPTLPLRLTLTTLLLRHTTHFSLGATNSISSISLSHAYNGLSSFSFPLVSFLTFLSNFSGAIFWISGSLVLFSKLHHINSSSSRRSRGLLLRQVVKENFKLTTMFYGVSALAVMCACMALREHLFVWTVFAPKFLYSVAWGVGVHGLVDGVLGVGVVGWLG
ncbi:MAG: hypothetical protein Q9227_006350 [Pyrenula ochraceoflavens]